MFIGHFGIAFGTKKITPSISLGLLFIAVQFLDLLWPIFLLLDVEHVVIEPGNTRMTPLNFLDYPVSHSLLMAVVWGVLVGGVFWLIRKNRKQAIILGLCVVSHWVLDLIVHRPDLPLLPGDSMKVGLGLWNHPYLECILEGVIFGVGLCYYLKTTVSKNAIGLYGIWVLAALLVLIQVGNIFGPPPTSVPAIAWLAQLQWVFVLFAFWVDRNRSLMIKS